VPLARSIAWFRRDLRLADNPAWNDACATADEVVALYVLDPTLFDRAGPHRRAQLIAHLHGLDAELRERGGRLRVERGVPSREVARVASATGAASVHLNADATPYSRRRDEAARAALTGLAWREHWGTMVHEPGRVVTAKGSVSRVFTPFATAWLDRSWTPWPEPTGAAVADVVGHGQPARGDAAFQDGGERAALERLAGFAEIADEYLDRRDLLADDGTSQLSADLRWGALSPRTAVVEIGRATPGRAAFVRQLAWRDWYAHLLWQLPDLRTSAMRPQFDRIRWRDDPDGLAAWQEGRTGVPIVDAGMRQLAQTGWMHNRARLICASFLVKDLLVDWRRGERWFFEQLADGDVAQNVGNWQWVAGTGPDAAPYFRVLNPVTQARRFDPDGEYVRRWVPELAGLDARSIHAPWEAAPLDLAAAGVVLGDTYPEPLVDHAAARDRALAAYDMAR
jgi:deoxyribodipyrimidine photo-lyase